MTLERYTVLLRPVIISLCFTILPFAAPLSYTIPTAGDGYGRSIQPATPQKTRSQSVYKEEKKKPVHRKRSLHAKDNESLWYSGYTNYKPPKVVLNLLNNPTKQNAIKYLEWQRLRTEKLMAAIRVLNQVTREMYSKKPKHLPDDLLVVFFSPECPHCIEQLRILKRVVKDYPKLDLILYPVDNPVSAKQLLERLGLGKYLVYNDPIVERLDTSNGVPYLVFISRSREKIVYTHGGTMNYEEIVERL